MDPTESGNSDPTPWRLDLPLYGFAPAKAPTLAVVRVPSIVTAADTQAGRPAIAAAAAATPAAAAASATPRRAMSSSRRSIGGALAAAMIEAAASMASLGSSRSGRMPRGGGGKRRADCPDACGAKDQGSDPAGSPTRRPIPPSARPASAVTGKPSPRQRPATGQNAKRAAADSEGVSALAKLLRPPENPLTTVMQAVKPFGSSTVTGRTPETWRPVVKKEQATLGPGFYRVGRWPERPRLLANREILSGGPTGLANADGWALRPASPGSPRSAVAATRFQFTARFPFNSSMPTGRQPPRLKDGLGGPGEYSVKRRAKTLARRPHSRVSVHQHPSMRLCNAVIDRKGRTRSLTNLVAGAACRRWPHKYVSNDIPVSLGCEHASTL